MTNDTQGKPAVPSPSLLHNWVSLAGIILAASSFFAVACLIALDFFRGFTNPYVGILTYVVAPAFLIAGLLMISAGALWERHRRRNLKPGDIPAFPRIDLNVPRQRHAFIGVAVVTAVFFLSTALGSYRTYQFTESVTFCGITCHSVMKPEYTAYLESPHARVACVQCHIGPGAGWYVKSKLSGAYQVYATIVDRYPRPIPTPIDNLRPARATCEQCHWPQKFYGATERTFHHYLPDEQNSLWTIQMLVKVGGGDARFGAVGGIHWHMAIANKIEYIASDNERQVIPWVRLTDQHGKATVYQSTDNPLKPEQIAAAQPRVMDCIDCHNRPTHVYHAPTDSVDLALQTGRIDRTIPHIKEQAVQALTRKYSTTGDAGRGIAETLTTFYQSKDPAFARTNATLIAQAVAETQRIYTQNFFPSMNVNWRVYPDNIGHLNFPGCYRCHDGNHTSADGKTITHDCNACHTLVAQGPAGKLETNLAGLDFKHPQDISGLWQQMKCSDCHAGSLVE
jgi:nitrate/TMAO reductase-like tetraheme cytochrome c subunit